MSYPLYLSILYTFLSSIPFYPLYLSILYIDRRGKGDKEVGERGEVEEVVSEVVSALSIL